MQIALVAVVLLAGMWFTVLKPKPAEESFTPTPSPAAAAPGTTGLSNAVDKAKAVSKTSDATNAKIQAATGGNATAAKSTATKATPTATKPAAAAKTTATKAKATATKPATAKSAVTKSAATKATVTSTAAAKAKVKSTTSAAGTKAKAVDVDPSDRLLAYLAKGKTLVVLFYGNGVDDKAARKAVHNTAKADPKHVVSAYVKIAKVGDYDALTSDIQIFQAPSILVIGKNRKASLLTGYVDTRAVQQAVGDARRGAAAAKSSK
ncbi:hypothetical protein [Baekduia sp. Peel2402]|uniref:hypothetical protein n=1 Tax=Baekduia sp. Peel2402 TaxID=3458296 RepID=UPI00403EB00B